ncbi:hypothetical protein Tco_0807705 [Tanacetum coccineum]
MVVKVGRIAAAVDDMVEYHDLDTHEAVAKVLGSKMFTTKSTFYLDDDHVEEKSSGSTTTHADFSQYDSFIFDLSIDSFPPADRSDFYHEEFAGELAHIISLPEYDCLIF